MQGHNIVSFEEILTRTITPHYQIWTNILVFSESQINQPHFQTLAWAQVFKWDIFFPPKYVSKLTYVPRTHTSWTRTTWRNTLKNLCSWYIFLVRMRPCLILPCTLLILGVDPSRGAAMQVNWNHSKLWSSKFQPWGQIFVQWQKACPQKT